MIKMRAILILFSYGNTLLLKNDLACILSYLVRFKNLSVTLLSDTLIKFQDINVICYKVSAKTIRNVFNRQFDENENKYFIYWSCHVIKNRGVLINKNILKINKLMEEICIKDREIFTIFDCCHSEELFQSRDKNVLIFYACRGNQKAAIIKYNNKPYSLFTKLLFEKMKLNIYKSPNTLLTAINIILLFYRKKFNSEKQISVANQNKFLNWLLNQ